MAILGYITSLVPLSLRNGPVKALEGNRTPIMNRLDVLRENQVMQLLSFSGWPIHMARTTATRNCYRNSVVTACSYNNAT